jgi:hypothetical protein
VNLLFLRFFSTQHFFREEYLYLLSKFQIATISIRNKQQLQSRKRST